MVATAASSTPPTTSGEYIAFFDRLVTLRRHFHTHPELSFREVNTQQTLRRFLIDEAGIAEQDIHACAGTGKLATVMDHASLSSSSRDMDALPMTEENPSLEYKSTTAGAAHMCGHDGHMTSLAGFAQLLQRRREHLPVNTCVRLLFQPAEEGHFGAVAMIKGGCLDGVDEVYGYHNVNFPEGVVAVKAGAVMSHGNTFRITLTGPGGHGSAPHQTLTITSRNISAHDSAIVTIAQVHGGEADNVIPSSVTMSGTTRDFAPAVADVIRTRMSAIVTHTAAAFGVQGTIQFDERYPATVNAVDQAEIVRKVAQSVAGEANVTADGLPLCASEDFSFYLKERPGAFFFIGTVSSASQNRTLHSSTFDFNDTILPVSVRMFLELAQHRLDCQLYDPVEMARIHCPMPSNTGATHAHTDAMLMIVDKTFARRRYFREKQREHRRKVYADEAAVKAQYEHLQSVLDNLQAGRPSSVAPREASDGPLSWYSVATVFKREAHRVLKDRQSLVTQTQEYQSLIQAMQRFAVMNIPEPLALLPAVKNEDEFVQFEFQASDERDDLFTCMDRIQFTWPGTIQMFRRLVETNMKAVNFPHYVETAST
ncbi:hypothetical protein DYB38_002064 [Aphanomyces astaci]|uniref:Peptidase M20 dimerisation domain-containing protein n=1 Tax=Aphanomyces astaci TaxID=112090 RepID=A0A397DE06_APHAT|nr:hypothetical protein DYB38_002064 [Aphanomyces astaci]